jgi:hypothetical protein
VDLFKRWRRSRSGQSIDAAPPSATVQTSAAPTSPLGSPPQARARRPSTMGRTAAEQAYLAQAATRAKQD